MMYSDLGNQSQVFELTQKLSEIHQEADSVTKYFNSWKEIVATSRPLLHMSGNLLRIATTTKKWWKIAASTSFLRDSMLSLMKFEGELLQISSPIR